MDVSLDLSGRDVLVVGSARAARHVIARYLAAGASVRLATRTPDAAPATVCLAEFPHGLDGWHRLVSSADLVVAVELLPSDDELLTRASSERRVWLTREAASATEPLGHVYLVGGGQGDGSSITASALSALSRADVVYYDRLGPYEQLGRWAPGAEAIDVGKTPGHHAVPQEEIQSMIVAAAKAGKTVVRLKGGDPFVFGRGGEEVLACRDAGVPVTVVSGVSSAISVPAAAGIPVTHRDVSRLFTVVSGHAPLEDDELAHLAGLGGTIVVLMGVGTLPHLLSGLARHGMSAQHPVAIIERGFSETQRTTIASVSDAAVVSSRIGVRSPAVVVIGEVVRLAAAAAEVA